MPAAVRFTIVPGNAIPGFMVTGFWTPGTAPGGSGQGVVLRIGQPYLRWAFGPAQAG